jgi:hypothetical protein
MLLKQKNGSVTEHIHVFKSHLKQLLAARYLNPNNEAILTSIMNLFATKP